MFQNLGQLTNVVVASLLLLTGVTIVLFIFPSQIPEGLEGDVASDHYPRGIMYVWILSSVIWLISALAGHMNSVNSSRKHWISKRSTITIAIVGIGYLIFATVGFLTAAFLLIVSLSYLCGERGYVPWVLGATSPLFMYFFLDRVLGVTLPTFIQF